MKRRVRKEVYRDVWEKVTVWDPAGTLQGYVQVETMPYHQQFGDIGMCDVV